MSAVSGDCRRRSVMVIRLYGVTIDCRARQEMYRYLATAPKHRSSYLHFEPGGGYARSRKDPLVLCLQYMMYTLHVILEKIKGEGKIEGDGGASSSKFLIRDHKFRINQSTNELSLIVIYPST